eukprot:779519-Rhodomonas_salina.1
MPRRAVIAAQNLAKEVSCAVFSCPCAWQRSVLMAVTALGSEEARGAQHGHAPSCPACADRSGERKGSSSSSSSSSKRAEPSGCALWRRAPARRGGARGSERGGGGGA